MGDILKTWAFEFHRYYAEVEKLPSGREIWRVMREDKPNNAHGIGYEYTDQKEALLQAQRLNNDQNTGFDAYRDRFTDPKKHNRFKEHLMFENAAKVFKEKETASLKAKILKPRNQENEDESSMKDYPNWGSFGERSTKKNSDVTMTDKVTFDY